MITIDEEVRTKLTILVDYIDREESKDEDCDTDEVINCLYQICDLVRSFI